MSQTEGMIVKMPNGAVEIKARRKLADPGAFEAFVEEIQTTLIQMKEADANATVCDFDVSQNPTTAEQFEMLFNALALAGVKVQRFRLFGCPALNDEAMKHIADHFTQDLTNETAPAEMHLSDCAITTDGFLSLMSAIEEKDVYPTKSIPGRTLPMYLRLENNYIDQAVIQEKVDAGIIRAFKKGPGSRQEVHDPAIKINLVTRAEGSYQQKTGEPPAPEDAPPPKQVWDQGPPKGKGGNQSWQQSRPPWSSGAGWSPAAQALPRWNSARPVGPSHVRPQVVRPLYGAGQGGVRMGAAGVRPGASWMQASARGSVGSATDRSRTPMGRGSSGGSGPWPPTGPPPKKNSGLPAPWEEQWSDEYQIPYYWNSETGESLWEKPTA